jgi:hypothetical protein
MGTTYSKKLMLGVCIMNFFLYIISWLFNDNVGFEVISAVTMKSSVFWVVMP